MPAPMPPLSSPSPAAVADAPPEQAVSGPGHRLRLTLLMAGACLPILGAVLIAPVLPQMQDHFADVPGADVLVPMALTVPALSLALLAPFAGVLVDRLGRKRLLVVSTVLYAILGTAPLWLDSLGAIVASRALVGVAEAAIMRERADALLFGPDALYTSRMQEISDRASTSRLPLIGPNRRAAELGALIGYGYDFRSNWRRAPAYIDRILKGAKPGELPVEQPNTFELVVNLKSAKALGITIPQSILVRADRVIE